MDIKRMVVKLGTANLCNNVGLLDSNIFNNIADQVIKLHKSSTEVIVVSSGAIKAGGERMKNMGLNTENLAKKEIAGIGARHLLNRWGNAFERHHREVGQVWVTFGNWSDEGEKRNIRSSILSYLINEIVPIVNEKDVVSDWEIKAMEQGISENDRLAQMISILIEADAILFLTNEGGIFEDDPKINPKARMYKEVDWQTNPEELIVIGKSGLVSSLGTGGIIAKLREASRCAEKGMQVAIAGKEKDVILRFAKGEYMGTKIGTKTEFK